MTKKEKAAYMKAYYKKNSDKYEAWKKWHSAYRKKKGGREKDVAGIILRRATITAFYNAAKSRPCADCNIKYKPWIMQFDHRPGTDKKANVSYLAARAKGTKELQKEIDKCDVVCANCHAERTHSRRNQGEL